jgi:hypothetical protein
MSAKTGQFDMLSAPRQKAISYQVKLKKLYRYNQKEPDGCENRNRTLILFVAIIPHEKRDPFVFHLKQ